MILSEHFDDAFRFAHDLHREQGRKNKDVPYVSHLLGVAAIVLEEGGSEDQAIAALLHDGPEDHGGRDTLEAIRDRFGADVARIVDACTDTYEDPKPDWQPRKAAYLERLPARRPDELLVSIADKVYNGRTIVADVREHGVGYLRNFSGGRDGTLWYYRTLADTFASIDGFESRLVGELERIVAELESLTSRA
jgi:GTP pyrophosphokinase